MRFWWAAAAAAVAIAALIGSEVGLAGTNAMRTASAAETFTVNVDGTNPKANETFFAYFPRVSTVHPGDSVVFHYVGVGEPHTATLGTLVDKAIGAYARLTP